MEALTRLERENACSGIRAFAPDGGSYVFVDFAAPLGRSVGPQTRSVRRPLRGLLECAIDRGVLLAPGEGFGDAFVTWARLCFTGVRLGRVLEGVARLEEAMGDWTASSDGDSD
jgi:aspartate/methionine/tyrosine aminotransferase